MSSWFSTNHQTEHQMRSQDTLQMLCFLGFEWLPFVTSPTYWLLFVWDVAAQPMRHDCPPPNWAKRDVVPANLRRRSKGAATLIVVDIVGAYLF